MSDRRGVVLLVALAAFAVLAAACSGGPQRAIDAGADAGRSAPPLPADVNVVLGRPTADSITASVLASRDHRVAIEARRASGGAVSTAPVSVIAAQPQNIELTGLTPDSTYRYVVVVDGVPTEPHSFHTARPADSTFTFTIDADPHNRDPKFVADEYSNTLRNVVADHPDFHVNLGDTFMTEKANPQTYAEAEATFVEMRPYLAAMAADVPLFLVNGNHEAELGWLLARPASRQTAVWSAQLRQRYYPSPVTNGFYSSGSTPDPYAGTARDGYYAWTWGDALFVVLDPFWYTASKPANGPDAGWGWTLGRQQYDWLRNVLDANRTGHTFVFIHHLVGGAAEARGGVEVANLFEWGGRNSDGSDGFDAHRPGWGKPIHQMLVEHHVTAVFHGHDHVYVKQDLDGIVYQEVPQSSVTDGNTRIAADYGYTHGDVRASSGHLRVQVGPSTVTVDYVRSVIPGRAPSAVANQFVDHHYEIAG